MTNQNGYLSSKIKQIEQKVIQISRENHEYLKQIEAHNQQMAVCLSAVTHNNKILDLISYNLTVIGEMSKNIENNLILIPDNRGKKYDGVV